MKFEQKAAKKKQTKPRAECKTQERHSCLCQNRAEAAWPHAGRENVPRACKGHPVAGPRTPRRDSHGGRRPGGRPGRRPRSSGPARPPSLRPPPRSSGPMPPLLLPLPARRPPPHLHAQQVLGQLRLHLPGHGGRGAGTRPRWIPELEYRRGRAGRGGAGGGGGGGSARLHPPRSGPGTAPRSGGACGGRQGARLV